MRLQDLLHERDNAFKNFADKTRQRGDARSSKPQPEYKAQTTRWDKIKAGAAKMKASGDRDLIKRRDRDFERVQQRAGTAQAHIDNKEDPSGQMRQRRDDQTAADAGRAQRVADRSMKKDEYESGRAKERAKMGQGDSEPTARAVPLHKSDEGKVRQLLRTLDPAQQQQLAQKIASVIPRLEYVTFKETLLIENENAVRGNDRALATLMKWVDQLAKHPGKMASLAAIAMEELDFKDNPAMKQEFRQKIESKFGRYTARAADRPVQRNTKKAVRSRGRAAGDKPTFGTRQQARDFAADQNQHGTKRRQVMDAGRKTEKGKRWSAATTSLRDA